MPQNSEQAKVQRAAARPGMPNGGGRIHAFASELRVATVERNGQQKLRLEGYASMVEKPYEMFDVFGEYNEVVSRSAFNQTLAQGPDVAFLVNHKGVTMARTVNGTLELSSDQTGLRSVAYLNPERQDVRDLVAAIRDGDINEMSFAFMIDDGDWADDFSEFRINRVNLDRGDVSAVNYGANPYTSIAARQAEILNDLHGLPVGAQRAAMDRLSAMTARADSPEFLVASTDAAIDEAMNLLSGVDVSSLPVEVQQALALLGAADSAVDEAMDAMGIPDPDEAGEPAERAAAGMKVAERMVNPGGRSIKLIEALLDL